MIRVNSIFVGKCSLYLSIIAIIFLIGGKKNQLAAVNVTNNITTEINNETAFPNLEDGKIYQGIINEAVANNLAQSSIGEIVQTVAMNFLGAEYQAGLLDQGNQEKLVVSLQKFDCLLFVETVLAIANNITNKQYGYQAFTQQLEAQRYWNGSINGYCSRLHYFSDWIKDNQRRGNVENITSQLGGINKNQKLNFMTTHRQSYSQLANNESNFKCIASMEASLPVTLNYIPTIDIKKIYPQLQPGDIIGVATNIAGLDFTHTGLVYHQTNGNVGLIHANPGGKVVIANDLKSYVENVENAIGIVVTRAYKSD
ncbi:hypothetical protein NIES4102_17100 [Chondrocystis sp. NIES-4102]|nr:hypothetical protein NIES4102_17100 [Chondrocystis sp. NIES-4102]